MSDLNVEFQAGRHFLDQVRRVPDSVIESFMMVLAREIIRMEYNATDVPLQIPFPDALSVVPFMGVQSHRLNYDIHSSNVVDGTVVALPSGRAEPLSGHDDMDGFMMLVSDSACGVYPMLPRDHLAGRLLEISFMSDILDMP